MRDIRGLAIGGGAGLLVALWLLLPPVAAQPESFAGRIAALSEEPGYFDTDNLISNERSYLHVAETLARAGPGGAYVGVGPDQNFSYIAISRPDVAIIVDVRRDNLLLHLLFKALFQLASTRVEYLSLLTGRSPPSPLTGWADRSAAAVVSYVDRAPRLDADGVATLQSRLGTAIRGFGLALSDGDLATIRRFHGRFMSAGLALQFNSTGRAPQWDYPTYRDLLLETDLGGVERSYVASESAFQFVKALQARNLIIPVVGDVAGNKALGAVGEFLRARQTPLAVLYASNIEFYLFGDGRFGRFVANLNRLPYAESGVLVRSVFRGGIRRQPGYNSASLVQSIGDLLDGYRQGRFRTYAELLSASR